MCCFCNCVRRGDAAGEEQGEGIEPLWWTRVRDLPLLGVTLGVVDGGMFGVAVWTLGDWELRVGVACKQFPDFLRGVLKGDRKGLESAAGGSVRRRFLGGDKSDGIPRVDEAGLMICSSSGSSSESSFSFEDSIATATAVL